jgi:hypothetical protein
MAPMAVSTAGWLHWAYCWAVGVLDPVDGIPAPPVPGCGLGPQLNTSELPPRLPAEGEVGTRCWHLRGVKQCVQGA